MARIPRRYNQHVFGVIQSGITCALAAAVSCAPFLSDSCFTATWLKSWLTSWAAILPVVLLAAPVIRRIVDRLTAATTTSCGSSPLTAAIAGRPAPLWF
ncbi:MAG TPA: DUF2798 domain-containing protein [Roseiarcus sp.]